MDNSTLIEAPAGLRSEYREPNNPYKRHPQLQVTAVPTLYEWDKQSNTVIKRLIEEDAYNEEKLSAFIL